MMRRPALLLVVLGLAACSPETVAVKHPRVGFEAPPGVVLYLQQGRGVLRVTFQGGIGLAPRVCTPFEGQLKEGPETDSRRHLLRQLARRPGHLPAKLLDAAGKPLGVGALCIFPTHRTADAAVLERYRIQLDEAGLARLRGGQPAAWFQAYAPLDDAQPGWRSVAWVLHLEPVP